MTEIEKKTEPARAGRAGRQSIRSSVRNSGPRADDTKNHKFRETNVKCRIGDGDLFGDARKLKYSYSVRTLQLRALKRIPSGSGTLSPIPNQLIIFSFRSIFRQC